MQISTIHKLQHALDTSKKVIKFAWRHAFVLASFAITIQIFYEGKTPVLEGEAIVFSIAFFCDWLKMKIMKVIKIMFIDGNSSNGNHAMEQMFESAKWSRPTQMGSAWNSYDPDSTAYYLRHSRYC